MFKGLIQLWKILTTWELPKSILNQNKNVTKEPCVVTLFIKHSRFLWSKVTRVRRKKSINLSAHIYQNLTGLFQKLVYDLLDIIGKVTELVGHWYFKNYAIKFMLAAHISPKITKIVKKYKQGSVGYCWSNLDIYWSFVSFT